MARVVRVTSISGNALLQIRAFVEVTNRTFVQAVFEESYFLDPELVRKKPVWFRDTARHSREHFKDVPPKGGVADRDGRQIKVQRANHLAQQAWAQYAGHKVVRGSGYGVRHIWGNPWNPDAFTAGWNLCYMPFWAGMATEDQHPDVEVQSAIRQASFDLFFRDHPVCPLPKFVRDPGFDLKGALGTVPVRLLCGESDQAR